MKHNFLILLVFLLFPVVTHSDEPSDDLYELNLLKDSLIAGTGLLLVGTGLLVDNLVTQEPANEVTLNIDDVNGFDRWSARAYNRPAEISSDVIAYSLMAMPSLLFIKKDFREILTISVMYSEALLLSMGLKETVKASVSRYRPYSYFANPHEDYYLEDSANSFFSGHATYAFTSAAFLTKIFSDYHPDSAWKYVVGISSFTAASTVGILRIASGNHFLSDVLAGAASGTLIGFFVPFLHELNEGSDLKLSLYSSKDSSLCFSVRHSF